MVSNTGGSVDGTVPNDAVDSRKPVKTGGKATQDITSGSDVAAGDVVDLALTRKGLTIFAGAEAQGDQQTGQYVSMASEGDNQSPLAVGLYVIAPDTNADRSRSAGDSGPGFGALNVAPIGGDLTLRASAAISQASGTSTAVDNLGWVKGFSAHLDVTQTRNGSTAKLDVYLQTQLASGDWQDIAHFTQVGVSVTAEIVDWGPGDGNISGIGAEGSAMTFDRFFAEQDAALGAATIRVMNLGDSMRVKWVYTAGDSSADDYTFALVMTPHS